MNDKIIDLNGKKLSSQQATYKDLWAIYVTMQQMTPALHFFLASNRKDFMRNNGQRIKSIQDFLTELQKRYWQITLVDGKGQFIREGDSFVFNEGMTKAEMDEEWENYLSQPCEIK